MNDTNIVEIVGGILKNTAEMFLNLVGLSFTSFFELLIVFVIVSFVWNVWATKTGRKVESGTIRYVTGPLGSGKSLFAARTIARSLMRGRPVVTNVKLVAGWEHIISGRFLMHKLLRNDRFLYEENIRRYYHFEPDISKVVDVGLACADCGADPGFCEHRQREGRGLMVIDEVDNQINNRNWSDKDQQVFLRKLRMARKRGWNVYLISQHMENTDKGARRIALENVRLVNWHQLARIPLLGTPILPFPLFLALTYRNKESLPGSIASERPTGRSLYRLSWHRKIYDTFQDYGFDGLGDDSVVTTFPVVLPFRRASERQLVDAARPEIEETV